MDLGFEGDFDVLLKSVNKVVHSDWIESESRNGWVHLKKLPFKIVFANDISKHAMAVWKSNFVPRGSDPDSYQLGSIVDFVKEHKVNGNVFPKADVVIGGFPCCDFSLSGKRLGFNSDKGHDGVRLAGSSEENRGRLYTWMREVVGMVNPLAFVAENVDGLASMAGVKDIIERDFSSVGAGYALAEATVFHTFRYGVPQTRSRIIFIGFRKDLLCGKPGSLAKAVMDIKPHPEPTHVDPDHAHFDEMSQLPLVTARDAFTGLVEPEMSRDLSQKHLSKANWYGKGLQGNSEVALDKPGPTIRAEHHGNIEFRRLSEEHGGNNLDELKMGLPERRLTVRECARLQTFPDNFKLVQMGVGGDQAYKVVGNAVPPLFAYHLASRLAEILARLKHGV